MTNAWAVSENEFGRIIALSDYNLDYNSLQSKFEDLTLLASKIAGTDISLINLLDAYNQWTIAQQGVHLDHMDREDSVCQYTIHEEQEFEIKHLTQDDRFNQQDYVTQTGLDYYYGIPLVTGEGYSVGALCVLDKQAKILSKDQKEMLQLIGKEIVERLDSIKQIERLENQNRQLINAKKLVAHDIRGPIAGIIGLAQVVDEYTQLDEILEYLKLIKESGESVLELASDILNEGIKPEGAVQQIKHMISLLGLKEKLNQLFAPRIKDKGLTLQFNLSPATAAVSFPKNKLQQIVGNLISNAIKFTPAGGQITVDLNLNKTYSQNTLGISVADTGMGMNADQVQAILSGSSESTVGTGGEVGYGLGLKLVRQLVHESGGTIDIKSALNEGTVFQLSIPLPR